MRAGAGRGRPAHPAGPPHQRRGYKIGRMSSGFSGITRQQWVTLFAAQAGYMLDAMDVLLFVFAVNAIRDQFGFSAAQAGLVSSFTLAFSAIGGIVFGILSDRIGRARSLMWSILIYSVASAGTALSWNLATLLFWRGAIGIGLGAEWSAGAVLVAETWPASIARRQSGLCSRAGRWVSAGGGDDGADFAAMGMANAVPFGTVPRPAGAGVAARIKGTGNLGTRTDTGKASVRGAV